MTLWTQDTRTQWGKAQPTNCPPMFIIPDTVPENSPPISIGPPTRADGHFEEDIAAVR